MRQRSSTNFLNWYLGVCSLFLWYRNIRHWRENYELPLTNKTNKILIRNYDDNYFKYDCESDEFHIFFWIHIENLCFFKLFKFLSIWIFFSIRIRLNDDILLVWIFHQFNCFRSIVCELGFIKHFFFRSLYSQSVKCSNLVFNACTKYLKHLIIFRIQLNIYICIV